MGKTWGALRGQKEGCAEVFFNKSKELSFAIFV